MFFFLVRSAGSTHDGAGNISADDRAGTVYNYRYNNGGGWTEVVPVV
jgi:hypothetical protein